MNIFWFTGLSGSGKSTIAERIIPLLKQQNISALILDGDAIRDKRPVKLGFSFEEVKFNNTEIANLCQEHSKLVDVILVPVISPYQSIRNEIRQILSPNFHLIYCDASLASVSQRDVKGLYQKAYKGEITNMIGISPTSPYENPQDADLILNTGVDGEGVELSTEKALNYILKITKK